MRKKISYTVEESVVNDFNKICKQNSVNKSALIEKLIVTYIEMDKKNHKIGCLK